MSDRERERALDRTYQACVAAAQDGVGGARAFWIIGATLRTALVAERDLILLDQQDDDAVSDAVVRDLLGALRERLTADERLAQ